MLIPKEKLITLEIAKESIIGIKMINKGVSLKSPKHCFLSSFLLLEKNNKISKWKNYLESLPSSYSNFPIFFKEEELEILQGSAFYSNNLII